MECTCQIWQPDECVFSKTNLILQNSHPYFYIKFNIRIATHVQAAEKTVKLLKTSEQEHLSFVSFNEIVKPVTEWSALRVVITSMYPKIDRYNGVWSFVGSKIRKHVYGMSRGPCNARNRITPMNISICFNEYPENMVPLKVVIIEEEDATEPISVFD